MIGKRGQVFILAAVIISAIVLSLVMAGNFVGVKEEPESFYDLSNEVKEESGMVIDYGVYNSKDVYNLAGNFSELVAEYIILKYPDVDFVFVYGNTSEISIENYRKDETYFELKSNSGILPGASQPVESKIEMNFGDASFSESVTQRIHDFQKYSWQTQIQNPGDENVLVRINQQDYYFTVRENQQFFIILMKTSKGEDFIDIK